LSIRTCRSPPQRCPAAEPPSHKLPPVQCPGQLVLGATSSVALAMPPQVRILWGHANAVWVSRLLALNFRRLRETLCQPLPSVKLKSAQIKLKSMSNQSSRSPSCDANAATIARMLPKCLRGQEADTHKADESDNVDRRLFEGTKTRAVLIRTNDFQEENP
jgi:hypothetical protein